MHIVRVADKYVEIYDESTQSVKFRLDFDDNCGSVSAYELAEDKRKELNNASIPTKE